MMRFKVDTIENVGENWLVADFGVDSDGKHYILTTDHVRCSEDESEGAKADAELVCALLNEHWQKIAEARLAARQGVLPLLNTEVAA